MRPLKAVRYRYLKYRRGQVPTPTQQARALGVLLDDTVRLTRTTTIEAGTEIGSHTTIMGTASIGGFGQITIGRWCAIGHDFIAVSSDHDWRYPNMNFHLYDELGIERRKLVKAPVNIGSACWIGDRVTVLAGADIGTGSVIGAASLVNSEIPPFSIAVGSPARVLRPRFNAEVTEMLLELAWWDWEPERLRRNREFFEIDLTTTPPAEARATVQP